jgi:REP element-mobilizing transposase RayT
MAGHTVESIFLPKTKCMSIRGYKIRNNQAIHFVTFSVVEWIDVFTRSIYKDIVVDSLRHCQEHKGLLLHSWCLMTNHIHMMMSAKNGDPSGILHAFKNLRLQPFY